MLTPLPWQTSQWQQLQKAIAGKRLPHALLLSGPDGIGLGHFASTLSAALLCSQPLSAREACGECKSCILFNAGNHPDMVLIKPEDTGKQIKVELIRNLIEFIQLSSQYGRYKLAIIDPAEAMNRSSTNSLLKTLEEPPPDALIILVSHQPTRLPITIRSRCQRINFNITSHETAVAWLQEQLSESSANAEKLLALSQGAPLKALAMQGSDSIHKQEVLLEDLMDLHHAQADPVRIAEKWQGMDAVEVLLWLILLFMQMTRIKLGGTEHHIKNSNIIVRLQDLTDELDLAQLVRCYDLALKHYHAVTGTISLNKQGILEDMIIYWQSLKP